MHILFVDWLEIRITKLLQILQKIIYWIKMQDLIQRSHCMSYQIRSNSTHSTNSKNSCSKTNLQFFASQELFVTGMADNRYCCRFVCVLVLDVALQVPLTGELSVAHLARHQPITRVVLDVAPHAGVAAQYFRADLERDRCCLVQRNAVALFVIL